MAGRRQIQPARVKTRMATVAQRANEGWRVKAGRRGTWGDLPGRQYLTMGARKTESMRQAPKMRPQATRAPSWLRPGKPAARRMRKAPPVAAADQRMPERTRRRMAGMGRSGLARCD